MPVQEPADFLRAKIKAKFGDVTIRSVFEKIGRPFSHDTFSRMLSPTRTTWISWPKDEQYLVLAEKLEMTREETTSLMKLVLYAKMPRAIRDEIFSIDESNQIGPIKVLSADPTSFPQIEVLDKLHNEIRRMAVQVLEKTNNPDLLKPLLDSQRVAEKHVDLINYAIDAGLDFRVRPNLEVLERRDMPLVEVVAQTPIDEMDLPKTGIRGDRIKNKKRA